MTLKFIRNQKQRHIDMSQTKCGNKMCDFHNDINYLKPVSGQAILSVLFD